MTKKTIAQRLLELEQSFDKLKQETDQRFDKVKEAQERMQMACAVLGQRVDDLENKVRKLRVWQQTRR